MIDNVRRVTPFILMGAIVAASAVAATAHDHGRGVVRTAKSGLWSVPETWERGTVPGRGDVVQVRAEHSITYDVNSDQPLRAVHVAGTLSFASERDTRLDAGLLKIQPGEDCTEDGFDCTVHLDAPPLEGERPSLIVGSSAAPVAAGCQALIRLVYFEGMNKDSLPAIVCCGGRMEIHGAPLNRTWVKLERTAKPGDVNIEVQGDLTGWRPGDRVILTGTHHPDGEPTVSTLAEGSQTEERHVVSVRRGEDRVWTLKLDDPLAFEHFAEGVFRGEVANLTRNVVIESAEPDGIRGHTMYHRYSAGSISYAEFRHLGKKDMLGKYAIHFHLCKDTMRGSSVVGASIWDSHNRWLTIHGTEYLVVRDCVGYKSLGHGFFLEDATEEFNVLDHNLAVLVLPGKPLPKQVLSFDANQGAGFWWANCQNTFTRNVAAECSEYGYQFECRKTADFDPQCEVLQPDGTRKKQDVRVLPFVRFEDNEGHSLPFFGLNLRGLNRPESGIIRFAEANKELASEAMDAIPDGSHPLHVRRLRFWDTRWPFHAGTTGVFLDGMDVYRSTYGIWRTVTDRHTYKNLSFREIGHRDLHMPLSIGLPDAEKNTGSGQGAYYAGIGGFSDDQPPITVITHTHLDGKSLVVRGTTSDSGPVKAVHVNGRRAHSTRDEFAQWEVTLDAPPSGETLTLLAAAEDAGGHVETAGHPAIYQATPAR